MVGSSITPAMRKAVGGQMATPSPPSTPLSSRRGFQPVRPDGGQQSEPEVETELDARS